MAEGTKIEWTHRPNTILATLNALVGCQKVSAGCKNCYAIEVANIRAGNPLPIIQEKFAGTVKFEGGKRVWTGKVTLTEKALLDPLRRKKPRTYFVNALSDLFYEGVPNEWVDKHFAVFALCPQHTFIVLTKRPERMRRYVSSIYSEASGMRIADAASGFFKGMSLNDRKLSAAEHAKIGGKFEWDGPLPNVWLGTSVENQDTANARIPELLQTPAALRFISAEPLLGPIDLNLISRPFEFHQSPYGWMTWLAKRLKWVIVGGESGPGARPMHPDWASSLRNQCASMKVPFFFKQWGAWKDGSDFADDAVAVLNDGRVCDGTKESLEKLDRESPVMPHSPTMMRKVGKKKAGHLLDGKEWHQFPEAA